MITRQIGQAMATATTRHNDNRQQKLVVFYEALEIIKSATGWKSGESKVVFAGTLGGQQAEIFLLNIGGQITLNLTVQNETFEPLKMTEMVNESDYLAWNLKIREKLTVSQEQPIITRVPPSNKIVNPKAVNKKAKIHDVTPLDHDTFRVKSGESGNEYFVRLLPNEQGGTCDCGWGQYRKYNDGYRSGCSHVQAVYRQLEGQRNRTTSAWSNLEDAKRQRRLVADIGDGVVLTLRKS